MIVLIYYFKKTDVSYVNGKKSVSYFILSGKIYENVEKFGHIFSE